MNNFPYTFWEGFVWGHFIKGGMVYIGYFTEERQGAEVVNELTDWAGQGGWRTRETTRATVSGVMFNSCASSGST